MPDKQGFPYAEVQLTKAGDVHDPNEVRALLDMVVAPATTDLLVLTHGWNNTMDEARGLYDKLLGLLRRALSEGQVPGIGSRSFAVLGLLWPSKKFADKELIASGAAGVRSAVGDDLLLDQLQELKELIDEPEADAALERAAQLVPLLEDRRTARAEFADLLRSALSQSETDDEDASTNLFALPGDQVMDRLSRPIRPAADGGTPRRGQAAGAGGPSGQAAGLRRFFAGGPKGAALKLLNYTTYYKMKERAGTVGRGGAYEVLSQVRARRADMGLHLVGHSFGARLVTAATAGPEGRPPLRPDSLTLLQAAFSHYSFAQDWEGTRDGAFRAVMSNHLVSGPVLITYTKNDIAVGLAYPLASLLLNQVAAGLGDKNDRFGGLGRNGAQRTPEAGDGSLLEVGGTYQFAPDKIYNLNADKVIGDHGEIAKGEVVYALLTAIAGTRQARTDDG
jgi:hypothetical protein